MDQDALRLLTGWYGCTREEECVVALPVYAKLSTTDKAGCRAVLHCSTGIAAAVKEAPSAVGTYVCKLEQRAVQVTKGLRPKAQSQGGRGVAAWAASA